MKFHFPFFRDLSHNNCNRIFRTGIVSITHWPFLEQKIFLHTKILICLCTYSPLPIMFWTSIYNKVNRAFIFAWSYSLFGVKIRWNGIRCIVNHLKDNVFTMNRKCWNNLFHPLKQSVSQAKQIVSTHDTELNSVDWCLFRALARCRKRCFWTIKSKWIAEWRLPPSIHLSIWLIYNDMIQKSE